MITVHSCPRKYDNINYYRTQQHTVAPTHTIYTYVMLYCVSRSTGQGGP